MPTGTRWLPIACSPFQRIDEGPVTTAKTGQGFSDLPVDRHGISTSASRTQAERRLAAFDVATDETELAIPLEN